MAVLLSGGHPETDIYVYLPKISVAHLRENGLVIDGGEISGRYPGVVITVLTFHWTVAEFLTSGVFIKLVYKAMFF